MLKDFDKFMSQLKETNATLDFYTDFNKIRRNVQNIEISLNMLNFLLGKDDLYSAVKALWDRDPKVFNVLEFEDKLNYVSSALADYTDASIYNYYCDSNDKDNINRKPNTGMIDQFMDYVKFTNDNVDEENKIVYDTILMIGDASGKEGQFSDSDKKTAENFGCEYMDVDDFVYKYNNR